MTNNAEFEKRKQLLTDLGCEFATEDDWTGEPGVDRRQFERPFFKSVKLPLSAEAWVSLCMQEGEDYVGGCCGNTSHAQDKLNYAFRFGGWIDADELLELAEAMRSHGDEAFEPLAKDADLAERCTQVRISIGARLEKPWEVIAFIVHVIRGFVILDRPAALAHVPPADRAISILSRAAWQLDYHQMIERMDRRAGNDTASQNAVRERLILARLLPALREVAAGFADTPAFEGVALVAKANPDVVCQNGLGYCVYETDSKELAETLAVWREDEKKEWNPPQKVDELFMTRPVRVSVEKGIEFL